MTEPEKIRSGNSAYWEKSFTDYPATSWALKYSIVSDKNRYEIIAAIVGDTFAVTVPTIDTVDWTPGNYRLIGFVEKANERVTVHDADFEILSNHLEPIDQRSFAEKVLEAIEATILNKATKDQLTMAINGKSITRYAPEQLIVFRDRFKREAAVERANRKAKQKGRISGRVQTRFR